MKRSSAEGPGRACKVPVLSPRMKASLLSCFRNGGPASGHAGTLEALRRRGMLVGGQLTEKGELMVRVLMVEKRLREQAERDGRLVVRCWKELEDEIKRVRKSLRTAK